MQDLFKTYSYPKQNYDYNYKEFVEDNYNPEKMGVSNTPTVKQFKKNVKAGNKYFDGLIFDGNPSKAYNKVDEYEDPPYKKFRIEYPESEYPTTGKYSSSYFVQSGFCPVNNAMTEDDCKSLDKNYIWIQNTINIPKVSMDFFKEGKDKLQEKDSDGKCFKPRYSYVNNSAQSNLLNGMVPSLIDDVSDLNPINFVSVSMGKTIMGKDNEPPRFQLLPCKEYFANYNNSQEKIFNTNISKTNNIMENFQSELAGSLYIDRPTLNRDYILPNNRNLDNEGSNNNLHNEEEHFFQPSPNDDSSDGYLEVQYNNCNNEKSYPPWVTEEQAERALCLSAYPKKPAKDEQDVSVPKSKANIFGYDPVTFLLLVIFIVTFIYLAFQEV